MNSQNTSSVAFGRSAYELESLSLFDAVAKAADFGHDAVAAARGWNDAKAAHYAWAERSRSAAARIQRVQDTRTQSRSVV